MGDNSLNQVLGLVSLAGAITLTGLFYSSVKGYEDKYQQLQIKNEQLQVQYEQLKKNFNSYQHGVKDSK